MDSNRAERFRTPLEFNRTGLVCSGGATKAAAFHIGVCLALRDRGFSFVGGRAENPPPVNSLPYPPARRHPFEIDTYVGSSAGAFIVAMLASGVPIESIVNSFSADSMLRGTDASKELPPITYREMLHVNWPNASSIINSFKKSSPFGKTLESMVLRNLRLPGLFSTKGLAKYLRKHALATENFHELNANLFILGTQLDHSRKMVFGRFGTEKTYDNYCQYTSRVRISDAVAASMSLPPIFVPYLIRHAGGQERYYIDGEIRETLSTHVAKDFGCDLIFVSYTHQPYHYQKETGSLIDYGVSAIIVQALYQAIEQKVYGSKKAHENKVITVDTVRKFFRDKEYPEEHLQELITQLQERLDFKEHVKYIFIHPEPRDKEMFFGDHFTLNPKLLQSVAGIGYRRAMAELRRYEFSPS